MDDDSFFGADAGNGAADLFRAAFTRSNSGFRDGSRTTQSAIVSTTSPPTGLLSMFGAVPIKRSINCSHTDEIPQASAKTLNRVEANHWYGRQTDRFDNRRTFGVRPNRA